jgi:hypothetical protein
VIQFSTEYIKFKLSAWDRGDPIQIQYRLYQNSNQFNFEQVIDIFLKYIIMSLLIA